MNDSTAHFSRTNSVEHPPNGVQTEFKYQGEIELIEKNISNWPEKDRLDCLLIRALLQLGKVQPDKAQDGVAAWDLVEAVSQLRNRAWSTSNDKERMSDDVRRQWKKIESLWQLKTEGIKQSLSDRGLNYFPKISRVEGGGTGRATKYFVEWQRITQESILAFEKIEPIHSNIIYGIKYICEDITNPGFLINAFTRGMLSRGWKRVIFIIFLILPTAILLAAIVLLLLNLIIAGPVSSNQLGPLITNVVMWGTISFSLFPLLTFSTKRIFLAPWWMQSEDSERLLEFRTPPRFESKSIKAVSYTSSCPICIGKVIVKSGGIEFFGRIIGRCNESPVEHVFSFDHVTRQGNWLRK